jgi:acetaldehyde dehydrogenase (acetylating)
MDLDLRAVQEARHLATRARAAADAWAKADQADVDRVVEAIARDGRAAAARLAEKSVAVTGYGRADHKMVKNLFNTTEVYEAIAPITTVGVLSSQPGIGVVEVAEPVGVVAGLVPTTNPVSTVFFKSLIAVKARNAVVLAPHPRAAEASLAAAQVVDEAARRAGAPAGLVSCLSEVALPGTNELMHHDLVSMVLATGSGAMVRAAYSSGKPTYAVGPGNVPTFIHRATADLDEAVEGTLASSVFDYGTPCASEQAIVVDRAVEPQVRSRLERLGARFLSDDETGLLTRALFTPGMTFDPECVGQSPAALAERAGIRVDPRTTVLVVRPGGIGREHPLSMEILTSTLKYYIADDDQHGLDICNELLRFAGDGHTAGIWTEDDRIAGAFAARARAFRVLVNTPTCFGAMGATAGLPPSFMLGTGTWGGGITADNIGPLHLINRKRVARGIRPWRQLTAVPAAEQAGDSALVASTHEDPRRVIEDLVQHALERLSQPVGGAS